MKVLIRRTPAGFTLYVPKKDLEEPIVATEHAGLWGGWVRLKNGWTLDLPLLAPDTRLPVTVNARKRPDASEDSES